MHAIVLHYNTEMHISGKILGQAQIASLITVQH